MSAVILIRPRLGRIRLRHDNAVQGRSMGSGRFDAFTRTLATILTRRGTLGALAALLTYLLAPLGLPSTAAKKKKGRGCRRVGKKCGGKHNRKCCGHAKCRGGRCKCTGQRKACRGKCIANANCCDDADCGGGASCQNGVCNCPSGEKACEGTCIPNDNCCTIADCGACESCQDGACVTGCATGQECVSGMCRCTMASCDGCCAADESCESGHDPDACGTGGNLCHECEQHETCPAGSCACEAPFTVCGADCVNLNNDNDHCGNCENACVGTATCQNGACKAGGTYAFVRKWDGGSAAFNHPLGIAVDGAGNVYVTDEAVNQVVKFTGDGEFLDDWSSVGTTPMGIAVNRNSGEIYVANLSSATIQTFASDTTPGISWDTLDAPEGVAVNQGNGEVYVAIDIEAAIQRFENDGEPIADWPTPPYSFDWPVGVAVAPSGDVYVSNNGSCNVQRFTADGDPLGEWGTEGSDPGQFEDPAGIAVDQAGDVYVCDSFNFRIQKFTATGEFVGDFGSQGDGDGQFEFPYGVAVSLSGYVYVVDGGNANVRQFIPA
jgi:DNA-binding beta-propeller fold protein YncE